MLYVEIDDLLFDPFFYLLISAAFHVLEPQANDGKLALIGSHQLLMLGDLQGTELLGLPSS